MIEYVCLALCIFRRGYFDDYVQHIACIPYPVARHVALSKYH